jgi:hypothetical protein
VEVVPSPKDQYQAVGEPVEVSVKVTVSCDFGREGEKVKLATGAEPAEVTVIDWLFVFEPKEFDAVSETAKVPTEE